MNTPGAGTARIVELGPGDAGEVLAARACFDHEPQAEATARFLRSPDHHLLLAYVGDDQAEPAGFVSGVELTHPDKGTEMFLYELGVVERFRGRGIGRGLVRALADLAVGRGCYGMWVLTDDENTAALRAYTAAGGEVGDSPRSVHWTFRSRG
ncbi:MAG TPA: GNAT family N-acetyltransferase [Actinopolymorphaceae bacterium]